MGMEFPISVFGAFPIGNASHGLGCQLFQLRRFFRSLDFQIIFFAEKDVPIMAAIVPAVLGNAAELGIIGGIQSDFHWDGFHEDAPLYDFREKAGS